MAMQKGNFASISHISLLICMMALFVLATTALALAQNSNEQKIQASLTYNFLKYTTWPAPIEKSENDDLQICMLGGDLFNGNLFALEGRTAQQRRIQIRLIDAPEQAEGCHIVTIHQSQNEKLGVVLASLENFDVLTVSNIQNFTQRGGMVEFSRAKDGRIHLYINRDALDSSDLKINPRLLNLAELERSG